MIDHTGHPHPSTPKARALCRANGGTGSTAKHGENAPTGSRTGGKIPTPSQPKVVDVTPKKVIPPASPKKVALPKPQVKEKVKVANVPFPTTFTPPPAVAKPLSSYIPPASKVNLGTGPRPTELIKIQNALRRGASRNFIVNQSKLKSEDTNQEIDRLLIRYGVPNHEYPRVVQLGTKPSAKGVKPSPVTSIRAVPTSPIPAIPESEMLRTVRGRVRVNSAVAQDTDRALTRQQGLVGNRINRIRGVKSGITPGKYPVAVGEGTLGMCMGGHIELHSHLHDHEATISKNRASGWFVKGGGTPVEQIITHEMAHALTIGFMDHPAQRKQIQKALIEHLGLEDTIGTRPVNRFDLDNMVAAPRNKAIIRRKVGKYAATNLIELVAEVWTDHTLNPKPKPYMRQMGLVLESIITKEVPS